MNYCTECGFELKSSNFCPKCGTKNEFKDGNDDTLTKDNKESLKSKPKSLSELINHFDSLEESPIFKDFELKYTWEKRLKKPILRFNCLSEDNYYLCENGIYTQNIDKSFNFLSNRDNKLFHSKSGEFKTIKSTSGNFNIKFKGIADEESIMLLIEFINETSSKYNNQFAKKTNLKEDSNEDSKRKNEALNTNNSKASRDIDEIILDSKSDSKNKTAIVFGALFILIVVIGIINSQSFVAAPSACECGEILAKTRLIGFENLTEQSKKENNACVRTYDTAQKATQKCWDKAVKENY